MLRDQQSIVQCCGYISEWKFNIKNPGTITFQVWRETGPGRYTLRGEYATHYNTGEEDSEVVVRTTFDKHLAVDVGDHIGWYNEKEAMVAFEIDSTGQGILINSVNTPVDVKNEMDWSQVLATESRTYAIQAIVSKGVAPKFKNLDADVEIFEHLTVGSDIYRLQLVDFVDDRVPITFRITMNDNMNHFEFNRSTLTAYLAKTPPVGKYNLVFTVSDHCGYSDTALLNVVVKKPKPAIINLPASVSVREDIGSVEVPLLNISVADSVPVICDVKSVEPTEESAFFSVKSNRFQASLYLKATHSLDYEKVQQYVLTIHCFNGHDSDSGLVNILVEPNQVPTIQNLPATVSVSSIRVNFGDSVYRITVEDAERNTVSLNSTCEPLPCPFTVTNAGFVIVVGNLFSAMSDMYIIHIVASDTYNTAPPKQLVVSVSDRNTPPYIYNIPDNLKIDLAENLPVGTLVLHVLASDVNPLDNLLFALQIQPSEFFPFFTINETSGEIYIRSFINYESLQESDVTLYPSVSDGHNTFSTDFKVSINDINEPPRFEHTSYWIKTNESNEGRVISKGIIKASDEDKDDQVTYSLECDLDEVNSIFQMNVETADITQTYNIDVDHLLTTERNITCRVIASDKLKATATAPLRIVVADINDNGPLFVKSSHVFVVTQDTPILSSEEM
ncbi:cadherin EGF LAG seven-pass G-type receptor 3-like [Dreissena polymorpha]|uniref:cadherin EGF LAG seven-pass G-type receptor 3-like n=1 Tax=Dreissena polymorpha TaxID=45954 RepID=UPI002263EB2E|nr:cadherin EGF LAG seven-pass G-type receptor 3-like [Dreissena polymorpha]